MLKLLTIWLAFMLAHGSMAIQVPETVSVEKRAIQWPNRILAPYIYLSQWGAFDIASCIDATGVKLWTLAFITGNDWGEPCWGGSDSIDTPFYSNYINLIRSKGGDVIISFGGAAGHELALVSKNEWELADKYQKVINKYNVNYIDVDIEGGAITNYDSIERRSKALKILRDRNPNLIIAYTLPCAPFGLVDAGIYTIKSAVWNGLKLDVINLMTMDYGGTSNPATGMGGYAISAAEGAYKQCTDAGLRNFKMGITPMIGKNDVPEEIFRVEDARQVTEYAKTHDFIRLIAYWSINRDTNVWGALYASSQITQKKFEFVNTFKSWIQTDGSTSAPAAVIIPVVKPPVLGVPDNVLSPYVDLLLWPTHDINKVSAAAGTKWFTLSYIVADSLSNPSWGGNVLMGEKFYMDYITKLRDNGGDVIVSFGGSEGKTLAQTNTDLALLQQKYQDVINAYSLKWIDFGINGAALSDTAANDRRSKALAGLRKYNPGLKISFTLPATPTGLTAPAVEVLKSAKNNGLTLDVVNVLALNFDNAQNKMSAYAKTAVENAYAQVQNVGLTSKMGITTMIGQQDIETVVFSVADVKDLALYAKSKSWITFMSYWSSNRDVSNIDGPLYASSKVTQADFDFAKAYMTWLDGTVPKTTTTTTKTMTTTTTTAAPSKVTLPVSDLAVPTRMFAPYCDVLLWPTFQVSQAAIETKNKWYTLAFITANGAGNPAWGSSIDINEKFYLGEITKLRELGGDVIISFGGAIGQELAVVTTDISLLTKKYQSVVDIYRVKVLDFDIEGGILSNENANTRRSKAIAALKSANPGLTTSITLPVMPTGLTQEGINILKNSVANGWKIDVINIMAMDYGPGAAPDGANSMGKYAISAAENTYNQATAIGLNNFKIGITAMIGQNDVAGEIFSPSNAQEVANYAIKNSWISLLSYWSINRDTNINGPLYASSQISQTLFQFAKIFNSYSTSTAVQVIDKPGKQPSNPGPTVFERPLTLDKPIFAPFCDILLWPTFDISLVYDSIGLPWFTLAFVTANSAGEPAWGSILPTKEKFYIEQLTKLRGKGGDAIVSFGGATGMELALVTKDAVSLQAKYQSVIDSYQLKWVDFDIEGSHIADAAANIRRAQAWVGLKKTNPKLIISVTLPVMPEGLTNFGLSLIKTAVDQGALIDVVNIMAMDYGSGQGKMGEYAISAAKNTWIQIKAAGLPNAKVGVTAMIGNNDVSGEVFTLENAATLVEFIKQNSWIGWASYWSINRDNAKSGPLYASSQITQELYGFAKIFADVIKSTTTIPPSTPPNGRPAPIMADPNFIGGYTWSKKVFAPFVETLGEKTDLLAISNTVGSSRYTLSFINPDSTGNPGWGGEISISKLWYLDQIQGLRLFGGEVLISFGGPTGKELATTSSTAKTLQMHYQNVIDAYTINWVDFYLVGGLLSDKVSIDRRNEALRNIQVLNPNIRVSYSLPASASGLEASGLYVIESALNYGVRVDEINVLTMNFNTVVSPTISTQSAATSAYKQISDLGLASKIGITLIPGSNTDARTTFTPDEVASLVTWSKKNDWIGFISYCYVAGDAGYVYAKAMVQYEN